MNKVKEYISDDDVVVIGGSDWQPEEKPRSQKKWKWAAIALCILMLLAIGLFVARHLLHSREFVQSRYADEVIEALAQPMSGEPGVTLIEDEAMGVRMKIYKLEGLKARMSLALPDITDTTIYLVTRSADYKLIGDRKEIIGDFVYNGKVMAESDWRAGFMAIVDGNAQIGIDRSGKLFNHIVENGGSMFRQLALISAGTRCDKQFILKGKVSRCAYARNRSGELFFIETVNPETLYGFADALIEYGFVDAVYITGGSQPDLFHRTPDSLPHGTYIDDKQHEFIVWTR
jgi:hypothetical protein